jgi:cytochrome oxidase Cu insertion factor (SCO1/SenC/PrrC family)
MKKVAVLFIIFGIWNGLVFGEVADAADYMMPSARVHPFSEKFNAPGFRIEDVDGNQVKLEDYRGKIVLLFFWTTW